MSKLPLSSLISAISAEDANLLAKTPGIGKKTAERIIIELKDKLAEFNAFAKSPDISPTRTSKPDSSTYSHSKREDAVLALQTLGYKRTEAEKAISKAIEIEGANVSTEALIKAALG